MIDANSVEPMPDDGAALLGEVLATLKRYVVFADEHQAIAVALWIAATHTLPAFECAPRLAVTSPEKRCGKSRLLDIIGGTCHRPLMTVNATVAAVFRSIGDGHPPTLIIDEADTIFGNKKVAENHEDLRALLNAGHQRGRPALRCVGPLQVPTEFPTFAMAVLAGIGSMPDTITDRGVNITMRRRAPGEKVSQFRSRRDGPILESLRDRLAAWAEGHLEELAQAEPTMPVTDRAADTWEPLVAVADAVGGDWPEMARAACKALVAAAEAADEEHSLAVTLLADIREVFAGSGQSFLASNVLIRELRSIEDSPWNDFDLTARKLAFRLKEFGVKPGYNSAKTVRGYRLEDLHDAFSRYIRPEPSDPPETRPDLGQSYGNSDVYGGSIYGSEKIYRDETAAQTPFSDSSVVPDWLPPENDAGPASPVLPPGGITEHTPGMTDRVQQILAKQKQAPA